MKTFLHRLDENVLKKGILVNVKVAYFTQDENSTQQSENQLKNYLRDFQNKYKYLKFQFIEAEGQFSRGRGECQRAKFLKLSNKKFSNEPNFGVAYFLTEMEIESQISYHGKIERF